MTIADPALEAKLAGLRYTPAGAPGYLRKRSGKGFVYIRPDGQRLTDKGELERIRSLAIPPAWTDVWISVRHDSHVQASGRDAKGRKQAIYHPSWRAHRDQTKFGHMREFGQFLPKIRLQVEHDLCLRGWPKRKAVALVVRLLETTLIRVGNKQYALENESYGLTTLSVDHAEVGSTVLRFHFKGKSGKFHEIEHRDRRLARLVRGCQDLPGQALFQYLDDDKSPNEVDSSDVNAYLRDVTGKDFTAKDFRTWAATIETLKLLREGELSVVQVVKSVALKLGNTPSVCRSSYIHPALLEATLPPPEWVTDKLPSRAPCGLSALEKLALDTLFKPPEVA